MYSGKVLRKYRKRLGLKQSEVATLINRAQCTVSVVESGTRTFPPARAKIAQALFDVAAQRGIQLDKAA